MIIVCLASATAPANAQELASENFTPVTMFIPTFQSPKGKSGIGRRTALVLGLQVWRTYSTTTDPGSSFDDANINYNSKSAPTNNIEVENLAMGQRQKPNLILWGRASKYGDGIVVESTLLIPGGWDKSNVGTNIWTVTIPTGKTSQKISVDVPSRQYEFAPIVLDPKILRLANANSSINVYEMKTMLSKTIGNISSTRIEARKHEGDWSQVILLKTSRLGWVYLPSLSENPSEVVNFCSGVIRFLQGDWSGAVKLFREVLKNSEAPTTIKVDSHLYMAMAYDRMHDENTSISMVADAYKLNPYSKTATQYLYMSYLSQLTRILPQNMKSEEAKNTIRSMKNLVAKNKILFATDDAWIVQAEAIIAALSD